jgi:hypothetical protein
LSSKKIAAGLLRVLASPRAESIDDSGAQIVLEGAVGRVGYLANKKLTGIDESRKISGSKRGRYG